MRAMKFRAWHKPSSAMMMVHTLHWNGNGECIGGYCHDDEWNEIAFDVTHTIIMQFTGLKDKNGKEIYEGDIVRKDGWIYEIRWSKYGAGFDLATKNDSWPKQEDGYAYHSGLYDTEIIEVIGNIYENPELIGGTQKEGK